MALATQLLLSKAPTGGQDDKSSRTETGQGVFVARALNSIHSSRAARQDENLHGYLLFRYYGLGFFSQIPSSDFGTLRGLELIRMNGQVLICTSKNSICFFFSFSPFFNLFFQFFLFFNFFLTLYTRHLSICSLFRIHSTGCDFQVSSIDLEQRIYIIIHNL